jgi:hypothetical protein
VVGTLLVKETFHVDVNAGESISHTAQHGAATPVPQLTPDEV